MPLETVKIEFTRLAPYEVAAQFFSIVAYPKEKDARLRFSDAICGLMLGEYSAGNDPEWNSAGQTVPPRYWQALVNGPKVEFDKGLRIINRERLVAAKMAAPKLEELRQFMMTRRSPGWGHSPTSNKVMDAITRDLGQAERRATRGRKGDGGDNRENIIRRHWNPSRPVLHLCLALHQYMHAESANHRNLNLRDFLSVPDAIAGIVELGEAFSLMMRIFGIDPGEQIEVMAA